MVFSIFFRIADSNQIIGYFGKGFDTYCKYEAYQILLLILFYIPFFGNILRLTYKCFLGDSYLMYSSICLDDVINE